jgi:hypothetical protein
MGKFSGRLVGADFRQYFGLGEAPRGFGNRLDFWRQGEIHRAGVSFIFNPNLFNIA